jgi:hypothetical protein
MIDATQIREHMDVVGSDDARIGEVDHVLGQDIKLTKAMALGKHHLLPLNLVARVDDKVHLAVTGEAAKKQWREQN